MCGIVGYIGKNEAIEVLIPGLRRLEYRGYDSAGVAVLYDDNVVLSRSVGKVSELACKINGDEGFTTGSRIGIAHTRWATHGIPSESNAHPHTDGTGRLVCVHNGIIDNFRSLRQQLISKGHRFSSETDSEVIPHLVQEFYQGDLFEATAAALRRIEGTYGIALMSADNPDQIIAARKGSPIVIGVGAGESIVASDVAAIVQHTSNVIFLDDGDIAVVKPDEIMVRNLDRVPVSREITTIDWDVEAAEKGNYDHFMLKEIFEQPEVLTNATRGRLDHRGADAILSGLDLSPRELVQINRVIMIGCGTSLHAGMVAEYLLEDLAGLVTEVEQAAEFRYRNPIINDRTLVVPISQSGETADTIAALREAKKKGAQVAGICNVVGSTIARECGRGIYLHAGPEIGVASTKAFTCQVTVLALLALRLARAHRMTGEMGRQLVDEIQALPTLVQAVLDEAPRIERIADKWAQCDDFFYIGRGYLYPAALEGALKLKEISYIHAEGYQAAELKHGPIALLTPEVPVVALANDIPGKDKTLGNIEECVAREAPVIITATEGDAQVKGLSDDIIWIPRTSRYLSAIPTVVALQLFSYYVAKRRGCSIDQPRNLAKSVTVE